MEYGRSAGLYSVLGLETGALAHALAASAVDPAGGWLNQVIGGGLGLAVVASASRCCCSGSGCSGPEWTSGANPGSCGSRNQRPRYFRSVSRRTTYFWLMGTCIVLILLAWNVVRLFSTTAAVVMSVVAMVIPPVAAVVANRRGGG